MNFRFEIKPEDLKIDKQVFESREFRAELDREARIREWNRSRKMDENVFWLRIWGMVVGGFLILAGIICYWDYAMTKAYLQNGYTRETVAGVQGMEWIKPK